MQCVCFTADCLKEGEPAVVANRVNDVLGTAVMASRRDIDVALVEQREHELKSSLEELNENKKLIEDSHGEKEVVLITDTEDYSCYRPLLPKPIFEDIDGRFVFAQF